MLEKERILSYLKTEKSKAKVIVLDDTNKYSSDTIKKMVGQLEAFRKIEKFVAGAPVTIKSIGQLKEFAEGEPIECFILLAGNARSSKSVWYDHHYQKFEIVNEIDDTTQFLYEAELFTKSNIGEAITKGNFYLY